MEKISGIVDSSIPLGDQPTINQVVAQLFFEKGNRLNLCASGISYAAKIVLGVADMIPEVRGYADNDGYTAISAENRLASALAKVRKWRDESHLQSDEFQIATSLLYLFQDRF